MTTAPEGAPDRTGAKVTVALPLALLESVRQHDRPRETLEDEDLSASLPRRLGLTEVVQSQIQHYEEQRKRGRRIPADSVRDLLQLVLRRPDAGTILRDAGHRIVRREFADRSALAAAAWRMLPDRLAWAAVRRAARRLCRRLVGDGAVKVTGRPFTLQVSGGLLSDLDGTAPPCALYSGLLEELLSVYTVNGPAVDHTRCTMRAESHCEWALGD